MDEMVVLLIPLLGTTLGAAMVFFMKDNINAKIEKTLLGFAAGVMIAASVWSLLIPAIDMSKEQGRIAWLPAAVGFMLGILFLLLIDSIVPHLHLDSDKPEGVKSKFSKTTMMMFAVTIHNIPEGMAVGVAYAGAIMGHSKLSLTAAVALSIGIAIQNFPEGICVAMPLRREGISRAKSFLAGQFSGMVEPIAGVLGALFALTVQSALPMALSFSAGAMIAVVCSELIPESFKDNKHLSTAGVLAGFVVMMLLDVSF